MKNLTHPSKILLEIFILGLALCSWTQNTYAQGAGFTCLFDSHGCDYTEVPPPPDKTPQPMLILNNPGATICLPYCSTEEDIIAAFQGWFDKLIDPVTDCPSVRIAIGFDGDVNGPEVQTEKVLTSTFGTNSFIYNMGQNVITGDVPTGQILMPAPCGGAITYNMTVEADCTDDGTYEGTTGATLTIIVGKFRVPTASAIVMNACESDSELNDEFQSWVSDLGTVTATNEEILAHGSACFDPTGCNFSFSFDIRKNGQTVTPLCIILGESLQDCMRREVNNLMDNRFRRCGGRIEVDIIHSSNNAACGQQTLMSQSSFEITTPQVTVNAPNNSELQLCTSDQDVLTAFQMWKDAFSFTTSESGCPHREEFYVNGSIEPLDRASINFDQFCGDTLEIDYRVINSGCVPFNQPEQVVAQRTRTFILNELIMADYDPNYMVCSTEPVGLDLLISPFIPNQDVKAQFYITGIAANGMTPDDQNSQVDPNTPVGKEAIKHDAWLNLTASLQPVTYTIVPVVDCDSTDLDPSVCTGQAVNIVVLVKPLECPENVELELMVDKTDTTYIYPEDLFCSNDNIVYDPPSGTNFAIGTHVVRILYTDLNLEICSFLIYVRERGIKTWHVDGSVVTPGDGTSWSQAFDNLQDALDTSVANDIIWVADGIYYPTVEFKSGVARSKNFYINKALKIFGGFSGDESDLDQRNWLQHETVLSGDIGVMDDLSDNAYNILYLAGSEELNEELVLDGFCITQSRGDGSDFAETRGGAIICDASTGDLSPLVRNCHFKHNYAQFGGAMYNFGSGNTCAPKIVQCIFTYNSADYGGALYNVAINGVCAPSVVNATFMFNLANESGSMMYNDASPGTVTPTFTNSIVSLNWQSMASPTQVFNSGATATFTNCIIEHRNGDVNPAWATDGGNNLYEDPQVVSVLGNYRLSKSSPGIDAGTPDTAGLCLTSVDLDGQPRLNGVIDIGPYENPFVNCPESMTIVDTYGAVDGTYAAQSSIILGEGLVIPASSTVTLDAPQVDFLSDVSSNLGAIVTILQDGCSPP